MSEEEDYKNKSSQLFCIDENGFLYSLSYGDVADFRTKKFDIVGKHNKYSIKNIQHWLEMLGSKTKILSKVYISEKAPLLFKCECGRVYESQWNRMSNINKCRCNICGEKIRTKIHTSIEDIKKEVEEYGYTLVDENTNNIKKIKIKDSEGNVYNANLFCLRYGYIYSKKSKLQSSLEIKTANYLMNLGIEYISQYIIEGCKNIKSCRFDFYLPKQNIIIEVHGEQHYKDSNFFGKTLQEQQRIDKYKKDFCIKSGYKYIEIPYTAFCKSKDGVNEYKNIIDKALK